MRFSERKGFVKVKTLVQREDIDPPLRNGLWNVLYSKLFTNMNFIYPNSPYQPAAIEKYVESLWLSHFKVPLDQAPQGVDNQVATIRDFFFKANWFQIYDLIEFTVSWCNNPPDIVAALNRVLEAELSAYRIVKGTVVEIVSETELQAVDEALSQKEFDGAAKHLQRAVELLFDRTNPDVRNSIKESISAVESAARIITKNPKATLGDALKCIEQHTPVHPALKEAFSKLYGYTSDTGGIRHAMIGDPKVTKADAQFFLISCSAFINYLKAKN